MARTLLEPIPVLIGPQHKTTMLIETNANVQQQYMSKCKQLYPIAV